MLKVILYLNNEHKVYDVKYLPWIDYPGLRQEFERRVTEISKVLPVRRRLGPNEVRFINNYSMRLITSPEQLYGLNCTEGCSDIIREIRMKEHVG